MKRKEILILILVLSAFFVARFLISLTVYNGDVNNHIQWGESLVKLGAVGFYDHNFLPFAAANYPPLANFLFLFFHKFFLWILPDGNIKFLAAFYKIPALLADIGIALTLYFIGRRKNLRTAIILALVFLLNPALFYNSVFWGQTESLAALFCLLAIFFFYTRKQILAYAVFALALLSKQSAYVLAPVFAILAIKKSSALEKIFGIVVFLAVLIIPFALFYNHNLIVNSFKFFVETAGGQTCQASLNAFNFWFLIGVNKIADSTSCFYLSYRAWSKILTLIFLVPVLIACFVKPNFERAIYTAALSFFIVFMFLTRMHERHLYTALVLFIPIILSPRRFWAYVLISIFHFLNQYFVWPLGFNDAPPNAPIFLLTKIIAFASLAIFACFYLDYFRLIRAKKL